MPIKLQEKYMIDKYPSEWKKQNWKAGYEVSFQIGILKSWNQNSSYPLNVMNKINDFKPIRN